MASRCSDAHDATRTDHPHTATRPAHWDLHGHSGAAVCMPWLTLHCTALRCPALRTPPTAAILPPLVQRRRRARPATGAVWLRNFSTRNCTAFASKLSSFEGATQELIGQFSSDELGVWLCICSSSCRVATCRRTGLKRSQTPPPVAQSAVQKRRPPCESIRQARRRAAGGQCTALDRCAFAGGWWSGHDMDRRLTGSMDA